MQSSHLQYVNYKSTHVDIFKMLTREKHKKYNSIGNIMCHQARSLLHFKASIRPADIFFNSKKVLINDRIHFIVI